MLKKMNKSFSLTNLCFVTVSKSIGKTDKKKKSSKNKTETETEIETEIKT